MEHILLVEDEPALRKLVGTFLRAEDYIVEEADSIERAKHILDTELIDLIVSDFKLGVNTAEDLYQWVCQKYPEMGDRFIVVSGWLGIDGFPYFLPKPFRLADLIKLIKRVMLESSTNQVPPNSTVREVL